MFHLSQILVALLSIAFFVICDYTSVSWAERASADGVFTWRLVCIMVLAPLGMLAFGFVGMKIGLAAVSGFINAGIVVASAVVGVLVRHEHLSPWQKIGIILGIIAILLVNMPSAGSLQEPAFQR